MPRKGPAYPISRQWQEDVLARIDELGISQNELARRAKISKASLSEALADGAIQSTVMPEIHRALGWPVPSALFTRDALELLALYDQMSERDQGALVERARNAVETHKRTPKR
jgi:lambda repressor-like predicted transcriptional regulator